MVHMLVSVAHSLKHFANEGEADFGMEQVRHGVDEDALRLAPMLRLVQHVRMLRDCEPVGIVAVTHRLEPPRHALGVAVLAPGRHLGAPSDGVPSGFGPLNLGLGHY